MLSLCLEMLTHGHDPEEEDGVAGEEEEDGDVVGQELHLEVGWGEGAVPQRHVRHMVDRQATVLTAQQQLTPRLRREDI